MLTSVFRQNLVSLIHTLASFFLFAGLAVFFLYKNPDPDYNDLLSVLIGALVTIVTVMFSAVLVALQLASAQFSPRITRSFFRHNRRVQAAFYLFLFGIAYCFALKFTYSSSTAAFRYPVLPISAAVFGFFLISFVLPRFVFYVADSINAATIAKDISERTIREIDLLYGSPIALHKPLINKVCPPKDQKNLVAVRLQNMGFLDRIEHQKLANYAQKHPNRQFFVEVLVGNFITPDEVAMYVQVPENQLLSKQEELFLQNIFITSKYRSYEQDVLFGVRQIVDMSIKAISPAVNDPTTCVNCLHYLGVIVRRFSKGSPVSLSMQNAPDNLYLREFSFEMLVNAAFDQIYQWGKHDYVVVSQLLNTLYEVVQGNENPVCRAVIRQQLEAMELNKNKFEQAEYQARVDKSLARLEEVL